MRSSAFERLVSEFPELSLLIERLKAILDEFDEKAVIIAKEISVRLSCNEDQLTILLDQLVACVYLRSEPAVRCEHCGVFQTCLEIRVCSDCGREMEASTPVECLYRFTEGTETSVKIGDILAKSIVVDAKSLPSLRLPTTAALRRAKSKSAGFHPARDAKSFPEAVDKLLGALFGSTNELRRWLAYGPEGESVLALLPGDSVGKADVVYKAVDVLDRRNLLNIEFFARLRDEFPGQIQAIDEVSSLWLLQRPKPKQRRTGTVGEPVAPDETSVVPSANSGSSRRRFEESSECKEQE